MADWLSIAKENGISAEVAAKALLSDGTRLEKLKLLLGIEGEDQDALLLLSLQSVEEMVLSYINQETLPSPLENILLIMCAAYQKSSALGSMDTGEGAVTSIKREGMQISYAAGASPSANTFDLTQDGNGFIGWKTLLNEYRAVRW